ncbi:MAG: hypothetical protein AB8D78_13720 [Akkermansiaceae bacterium]
MKKNITLLSGILGAAFIFSSCSDSDRNNGNGGPAGPANASAFAGTSVSFNPTITFFSGGIVEWVNEEVGTGFLEASESDPLGGIYTYEPNRDFSAGILTVTIDGEQAQLFDIGEFVVVDGLVQSFTLNSAGQNFLATVSGDLEATEVNDNNGGNNGGDGGTGGGPTDNFTFQDNGNLAPGTTFMRNFLATNPQGDISNSPLRNYNSGETVDFEVADDGSLLFDGADGPLALGFVSSTEDGIISYQDAANGGSVNAVFATNDSDSGSDFTITWTGPIDVFNPGAPSIDPKVFANQ